MTYLDYSLCFKALGDETRLKIFDMLKAGKLCACKILEAFHCSQPTLSYHMKTLVESGLVFLEKDGKWRHYSINFEVLEKLSDFISNAVKLNGGCLCE